MAEAAAAESFLCPVCHEDLTEPKILPCTHLLCRECVLSTLKKKRRSGKSECPQCQTPIISGDTKDLEDFDALVDQLPTDHTTGVQVQCKKTLTGSAICTVCDSDSEAESFCFECDTKLCSTCAKVHSRLPFSSTHTVEKLAAVTAEQLASKKQFPCSSHKEKSVEMYCGVHEELVCYPCATSTHKKCDGVEDIATAAASKRKELEDMKKRLAEKVASLAEEIQDCENQMTEAETKFAGMQDRVVAVFSEIIKSFDDRKQKLLREIRERQQIFLDEKLANKNNLEAVRSSAEAHVGGIDRLLSSESDQAVLATYSKVNPRLIQVESEEAETVDDALIGNVYFDERLVNGLKKLAAGTGEVRDSPLEQDKSSLTHCVACNAISVTEGTFQFVIEKPEPGCSYLMSQPCFIRNMPWKLRVCPWYQEKEHLGVFLHIDVFDLPDSFSCKANGYLKLLKNKANGPPLQKEIDDIFNHSDTNWGYPNFIAMARLLDPQNGYLQDEKLTFEVHVAPDAPGVIG